MAMSSPSKSKPSTTVVMMKKLQITIKNLRIQKIIKTGYSRKWFFSPRHVP